jgi:hypothetical protein
LHGTSILTKRRSRKLSEDEIFSHFLFFPVATKCWGSSPEREFQLLVQIGSNILILSLCLLSVRSIPSAISSSHGPAFSACTISLRQRGISATDLVNDQFMCFSICRLFAHIHVILRIFQTLGAFSALGGYRGHL